MAYHVELADSNDLIDLAASPYKVMPGSQLGMPAFDLLFSSPWQRGYQPLVAYNVRNRTPKLVLTITGTSHDDVIDNYNRIAAIEAYRDGKLIERSRALGARMFAELQRLASRHAVIGDVRGGHGLFAVVEMVLFIVTLLCVYAYVWRRGGLEWD